STTYTRNPRPKPRKGMAKRPARGAHGPLESRKRQKLTREPPTSEDVTTSRQLKKLLEFHQDARDARHGLQSFKLLLDAIVANKDNEGELAILSGYLEAVNPVVEGPEAVYVPEIMTMWSYGASVGNDDLLSEVAALLALLLQATSLSLGLLPYGRGICETLLQEKQLKLISKNLSADKDKGFVISPALRLLRELVSYDGGVFSRRVFRAQSWTFAELTRNLDIRFRAEGVEDARKPSVRTNAARFLFACLKYLPSDNKSELLVQKGIMPGLLMRLPDDPPALVHEALDCMTKDVIEDQKIPTTTKSRVFWVRLMERLAGLYSYSHDPEDAEITVADRVHDFLMLTCTSPAAGILSKCNGLYPNSIILDDFSTGDFLWSDMGLEQLSWMDQYASDITVRNSSLLEVALKLRPWASIKQGELLVAIFKAAPEIIHVYFLEQKSFTFDPKLSMTWIGYSSFLFHTMQLPVPEHFGLQGDYASIPPPTSALLASIIPLPLTQNALVRCLEPKWPLVSLFATRLLILALEKLQTVLSMHAEAAAGLKNSPWRYASKKLVNDFCQRLPDLKDIVRWYKSIPDDSILCKATASQLLSLYYKVLPQVALAANFDVSPFLAKTLGSLDKPFEDPRDKGLVLLELENLLEAASLSPGMRWFSKLQGFPVSPFTVLLKLASSGGENESSETLRSILESVATEHQIVLDDAGLGPVFQALEILTKVDPEVSLDGVWSLLDNCVAKCAASPLKYLDLIPEYVGEAHEASAEINISLLTIALVEQLPFAVKSASSADLGTISKFISAFLGSSISAGENKDWIKALTKRMNSTLTAKTTIELPKSTKGAGTSKSKSKKSDEVKSRTSTAAQGKSAETVVISQEHLKGMLHEPFDGTEDNSALTKWANKGIDDILEDDYAAALIRLLGSEHTSIRMEALTNILKLAAKIRASTHSERDQLWLLLSELAESARGHVNTGPVPSAFTAFAIHSLPVLINPLHPLYPKVNKYLTRAPVWPAGKIPMVHDVLHGEPSDDDKYYTELSWLFGFLFDCLQRPGDIGVFHQTRWFEKVFASACNPYMKSGLRMKVFKVLYRATCIEGGSTTLVTRFGVLSWLESLGAGLEEEEERALVKALMERVWETCDQGHVEKWSRGGIVGMMKREREVEVVA
ncbi:hypothetical protein jhhlp_004403, partial [Lomentospora prolificans]